MSARSHEERFGVVPEVDQEIYRRAGFGRPATWRPRSALLVVDALWGFIGTKDQDVFAAIEEYPTACGHAGWAALPRVSKALGAFRARGLPVVYVCAVPGASERYGSTTRVSRMPMGNRAYRIPEVISPEADELVIEKSKASAFFRTPLDIHLHRLGVQTVVVAGSTTSGCIRATVVDAFSHGFETIILEDGVWDRSSFSHAVSLFELSRKYASLATADAVAETLAGESAVGVPEGMPGEAPR